MKEENINRGKINRRELFKKTGSGLCFLGMAGLLGCAPESPDSEDALEKEKKQNQKGKKGLVNPTPSPWFTTLEKGQVRCELCPKECELEEGERGACRVRENREGKGYTLAYGNPALLQEDPVERKPFFHVVPGSRALSISTAGCNLECKFCEVWDMALENPEDVYAYNMPPERVMQYARDAGVRSVSYAFGEPVIFYEYMEDVAELAKEAGMLNLMHTAGYIKPGPLQKILDKMDAVNVDLKGFDPSFYREVVGGELEHVLEALQLIREKDVFLEITNILIPTLNDDMEQIKEMCRWIAQELGPRVPLHFARFYPLYRLSDLPRTPASTLDKAREAAFEAGLEYVYVAGVSEHEGENTFCPQCGEKIIKRIGFVIEELHVENNRCAYCGREIPGIWS